MSKERGPRDLFVSPEPDVLASYESRCQHYSSSYSTLDSSLVRRSPDTPPREDERGGRRQGWESPGGLGASPAENPFSSGPNASIYPHTPHSVPECPPVIRTR